LGASLIWVRHGSFYLTLKSH